MKHKKQSDCGRYTIHINWMGREDYYCNQCRKIQRACKCYTEQASLDDLGLDDYIYEEGKQQRDSSMYPPLDGNPWTFVFPALEPVHVDTRNWDERHLDKYYEHSPYLHSPHRVTSNLLPAEVVIIDNRRWNYEVRTYMDILGNNEDFSWDVNREVDGYRRILGNDFWLSAFMSQRWSDIKEAVLNQHVTGEVPVAIREGIESDLGYGVRSPRLGNGGWHDVWMIRHNLIKTRYRSSLCLTEGTPELQAEMLALMEAP